MNFRLIVACFWFGAFIPAASAGVAQRVNDLVPKLGATNVEDRYGPQMELQSLAARASRPGAEAERVELARVMAARAADATVSQPARVWMVRLLEWCGGAEAVQALTALLNGQDLELRECARRALEKNSSPAATENLRTALEKGGDASWRIGLIQSLGERGDQRSVGLIAQSLDNRDLAFAASCALAKIADERAIKALWRAFDHKNAAAAAALIAAADTLVAKDNFRRSAAIYSRLYAAAANGQVRAAALIGLAKAQPAEAKRIIPEALSGVDAKLQSAAISAAREVYGKNVSDVLAGLLPNLNVQAKIFALRALEPSAETQVIAAAADADQTVRVAALETLGQIGSSKSVTVLMTAAVEKSGDEQKTAAIALAAISGPSAGDTIAKMAAQGQSPFRAAAISALAARNDRASAPALLGYASDPDRLVSRAACAGLEKIGSEAELEGLARLALSGTSPGAEAALQAVASRAKDKAGAAKTILALSQAAEPGQAAALFETLTIVGGSQALTAVSTAAASENQTVKDAAIRALASWPDFAAVQPLLAIATSANVKRIHNVLAVQGVLRLVKSSERESATARLDAAVAAMMAAQRDEEKRLGLSAIAAIPTAQAAEAIKPYLNDAKLRTEAGLAGAALAQTLAKTDEPAAKSLAMAVKDADVSQSATQKAEAVLRR